MIPHLELNQGTFYPKGGLRSIPETLIKEGERLGVSYKTQEGVDQILTTSKKVTGIKTAEGIYKFDIVISNADVHSTYKKLLKEVPAPKKVLNQERSSSGIIFYWGIKKEFPELELHNIFFSETYKEEFKALFETGSIIEDPTVYLNISSKVDQNDSPKGAENWFILINAPANKGQDWDVLIKQVRKNVIKKLERILNQEIEKHIDFEAVLDPRIIERKTSSYQGSLYGSSSNNKYAAFLRHTNNHKNIEGLYFCGGSVHPGGGIPLCLNSAKIVSNLI
jgi:phytoene desaturase